MTEVKTECKNNVLKKIGEVQLQGAGSRAVSKKEKNKDNLSIILI